MFHDQPLKPLDKAVYWIEYVIRHNGAHHLKTAGDKLNWLQFLSIDVMLVLLIVQFLLLNILFYIMKKMYKLFILFRETYTENNDDADKKDK